MNIENPSFVGITIDDSYARLLDDGFWIEKIPGAYRIRVFISNVADKVHPLTSPEIYQAAYDRVHSINNAHGRTSMLPLLLVEEHLTLSPWIVRKAICFELLLDCEKFELQDVSCFESNFKSRLKLSFETVEDFLTDKLQPNTFPDAIKEVLTLGHIIASNLREKRKKVRSPIPREFEKFLNQEWQFLSESFEGQPGHMLIKEIMLLVNYHITEFAVKNGIPFIFRVNSLRKDLIMANNDEKGLDALAWLFQKMKIEEGLESLMRPACYSNRYDQHWALALPFYSQCTSPMRRLSDLINQINILSYLRKESSYPFPSSTLFSIVGHINKTMAQHARPPLAEEALPQMNVPLVKKEDAIIQKASPEKISEDKASLVIIEPIGNDYISTLHHIAQKAHLTLPKFTYEKVSRSKMRPLFLCQAKMIVSNVLYTAFAESSTQKKAKQNSAKALYHKLSSVFEYIENP
jgi:exoribonuclease R